MKTSRASTGSKRRPMKNSRNQKGASAAELALKAHVLRSNPEILAEVTEGDRMIKKGAISLLLLDGDAIAESMIRNGIGVVRRAVQLFDLDPEFFRFPAADSFL